MVVSAQAFGFSPGTSTASAPPFTSSRNPTMSDTIMGVPQAMLSSSVTPNDARVVGQR